MSSSTPEVDKPKETHGWCPSFISFFISAPGSAEVRRNCACGDGGLAAYCRGYVVLTEHRFF